MYYLTNHVIRKYLTSHGGKKIFNVQNDSFETVVVFNTILLGKTINGVSEI